MVRLGWPSHEAAKAGWERHDEYTAIMSKVNHKTEMNAHERMGANGISQFWAAETDFTNRLHRHTRPARERIR